MASNQDFYFVTNVIGSVDYEHLNRNLQQIYANIRFGPPLDSEKKYQSELVHQGFIGLYAKRENFTFSVRESVGEASVSLENAVKMGFDALSR